MPELNLDLDYFEHPKVMMLAEALGDWAEILPIRLWRFTAKFHAATGEITGHSVSLIERHLNWRGKKGEGIKALVTFGFMHEIDGGYRVHDFLEHQGHIESYKIRSKAAAKARWAKNETDATSMLQACNKHPPSNARTERNGTERNGTVTSPQTASRFPKAKPRADAVEEIVAATNKELGFHDK